MNALSHWQDSTITQPIVIEHASGRLHIRPLGDGNSELRAQPRDSRIVALNSPCVTSYPLPLIRAIVDAFGAVWACDEISRDVDASEASLDVQHSVQAYFPDEVFSRRVRILDYGCGSGCSSMTLTRLFPNAEVHGIDFVDKLLDVARQRSAYYGAPNLTFETVRSTGHRFNNDYDFVFLNAVYEHTLPDERQAVLDAVWSALKPGGVMILNQTPHRWFPIETHTTGLPLINYLPQSAALAATRRYCRRSIAQATWPELLRAGIRGASVHEVMRNIHRTDRTARRLNPIRLAHSWAGIWYATKRARLHKVSGRLRSAILATQVVVETLHLPVSPYLSIAVEKSS
jgi:SAM-dependent methyltransferase